MAIGQKAAPGPSAIAEKHAEHGQSYAKTLSAAFRQAAEKVLPAVVTVRTTAEVAELSEEESSDGHDFHEMPFDELFKSQPELRRFFRDLPSMPGRKMPRFGLSGSGSGVIIDPSGVILTNNHVVAGGGKIVVRLQDGREFAAREVKSDPKTDLAILRLENASSLTAARLGDSDEVDVGDWVLALGQPFGLEGTVTAGIISAKGRGLGIAARENFLQTDASINPGNSGGPLVNLDGEVIGINTAISSRSGGNQGVGFAVPINLARWVAQQLQDRGTVRRAYLGVLIQPVSQALADQFGVKVNGGVVVSEVLPDSPAGKAGLKSGDVIVEFNGKAVSSPNELQGEVEQAQIGKAQALAIQRDGKRLTLQVVVREQPEKIDLAKTEGSPSGNQGSSSRFDKLGLEVSALTAEVAEQLDVKADHGVVVTQVKPGTLADMAGVVQGMVITEVNRKPVRSVDEFQKAVEARTVEQGVLLLIRSEQGSRYIVLRASP